MAFETSTLVNGEWTTRTLDVDTVLRHYDQKDKEATTTFMEVETAPTIGILTQTVIHSPLIHWILPVKLKDVHTQHVAFIGDEFVQIKELRPDGHLWDVLRKENFGARIRNARVVGSIKAYEEDITIRDAQVKDEDDDVSMDNGGAQWKAKTLDKPNLPPQFILLQLHTGDSVFLRLYQSESGKLAFVSSRHRVTKPMLTLQPGMHLAIDPSSRYVAIGCSERVFAIYALHSREELKEQCSKGPSLRHVESEWMIYLNGHIQKMEFLYPSPDDEEHIILLVLMIVKGKTRMLLYEWETGSDLKHIRPHSARGHLLEKSRQMPLLLIPLTLKSSFILVCEDSMAVCQGILQGSPTFIDFNNRIDKPTDLHHGSGRPLWTAWTRPPRLPSFGEFRDDIYIAREDGLIKFLEIDSREDEFVKADNNIGEFGANCGTALACLDFKNQYNKSGDLLVTGGDACPGGTYLNQARKTPTLTQPIPNWSPAHDFATTCHDIERNHFANGDTRRNKTAFPKPDRLFACVGKGIKSAITEFRYGLEGKLGLEMDYEIPIMQAWVLLPQDSDGADEDGGSMFLLSVGDHSALLQLSSNASDIVEIDATSTCFDLRFRTIAAAMHGRYTIQVTEQSIVVADGRHCHVYELRELLELHPGQEIPSNLDSEIYNAAIGEGVVIYTVYNGGCTYVQELRLDTSTHDSMQVDDYTTSRASTNVRTITMISCHVTSLAIGQSESGPFTVIAGWDEESIILFFQPIHVAGQRTLRIPYSFGDENIRLEAIVSLVITSILSGNFLLLCGTRNGRVLTLEISGTTLEIVLSRCDQIGATPAMLSKDEYSNSGDLFFASCDSKVYALTLKTSDTSASSSSRCLRSLSINQVWLTDALKPDLQQPKITSIARMPPDGLSSADSSLLLIAGSQILLAELSTQPKAVPRQMSIGGTPTRLLYSHTLEVLIVAVSVDGKSTLLFIDPETGADVSQPIEQKSKLPVEFISGLGNSNERVFRLFEWPYTKDGKTWNFIIVSTDTGRLLIISVANQDRVREDIQRASYHGIGDTSHVRSKISYYTRYKFKCAEPVYSVTGFADGLLWCAGETLFCDVLDLAEKKFKREAQHQLPSPAIDLSYDNGNIFALTRAHSLELLRLVPIHGEFQIVRTHGDPLSRVSLHHAMLDIPLSDRPIHLVSDKMCSIVGLWPTQNTKADTLVPLFEAELSYSVLRFRAAECRPVWDNVWMPKGPVSNANDSSKIISVGNFQSPGKQSELLGLSITGGLSHYTFLDFSTWQFLRFLINLAIRSPTLCEFTYQDDPVPLDVVLEPKLMMHVDGDILKRCLEERKLEELLRIGEDSVEAKKIFETFYQLLQSAHDGALKENGLATAYIDHAYAFLEVYLRPVL